MPARARRRPPELRWDHARPTTAPAPAGPAGEARLTELVSPGACALGDEDRRRGLRPRLLARPVLVAGVVAMIWRPVPSVRHLVRTRAREDRRWAPKRAVRQQALSRRRRCRPAALCERVGHDRLPTLPARAAGRAHPRPPLIGQAQRAGAHVWAVAGTTVAALFQKGGAAVRDLASKLPVTLWRAPDPTAPDQRFRDRGQPVLTAPPCASATAASAPAPAAIGSPPPTTASSPAAAPPPPGPGWRRSCWPPPTCATASCAWAPIAPPPAPTRCAWARARAAGAGSAP